MNYPPYGRFLWSVLIDLWSVFTTVLLLLYEKIDVILQMKIKAIL